jgi:uncharacterized protein
MFEPWVYFAIAGLGLVAGVLGGMLGVGGSTVMIPGLVFLFGQTRVDGFNQHLYQAAAMIVTVLISAPAAWRHYRAGAIVPRALRLILPAALAATVLGVWLSNSRVFREGVGDAAGPVVLGRVLAVFLVYVIIENILRMSETPWPVGRPVDLAPITRPRCATVGGAMGLVAGLTGLGGGAVAVPLQQVLLKLQLRNCIANSSAMICLTGIVGAIYKNATLGQHDLSAGPSLMLAALLAPTALLGGYWGAWMTHAMPIRLVRGVFIALMAVAAWRMADF